MGTTLKSTSGDLSLCRSLAWSDQLQSLCFQLPKYLLTELPGSQVLVASFSWPSMNSHWAPESQWEARWWPLLIPGQRVHSEEGRPESSHSYRYPLPQPTVWPSGPRPGGSLAWASSVTPLPQAFPTLWLCRLVLPLEHTITLPCSDTGFGGDHENPGGKARLCPGRTGHSQRGELT